MELEEMKTAWNELERRLTVTEASNRRLTERARTYSVRRALRAIGSGQAVQIAIWVAVIGVVAPFWIENRHTFHLLIAGLTLHAYAVATICLSVVQILMVARIRYSQPVVSLQERMLELRRFRIRADALLSLPWWMLWIVATMVGAKLVANIDLYAASPAWILGTLAFGLVGIVATVVLARRFNRPGGFFSRLADDMAGRRLVRTLAKLEDLKLFGRE